MVDKKNRKRNEKCWHAAKYPIMDSAPLNQQQATMNLARKIINAIRPSNTAFQSPPDHSHKANAATFKEAMERIPLLLDEKTYNTAHPQYDANAVRNYPGTIFNHDVPC